jgi:hypothetical protein
MSTFPLDLIDVVASQRSMTPLESRRLLGGRQSPFGS